MFLVNLTYDIPAAINNGCVSDACMDETIIKHTYTQCELMSTSRVSHKSSGARSIEDRPYSEPKVSPSTQHYHARGEETTAVHITNGTLQGPLKSKREVFRQILTLT